MALVAAWMLIWAMAFKLSGKEDWQFTPPWQVAESLWEGLRDGSIPRELGASLFRVGYGFTLALGLGVAIGLAAATNRVVEWLVGPLVLGVQSLPSICWLPVAILVFGVNERAILFVVLMGSVGSISIAIRDGVRQVPLTYQRVASTFGASAWQRLFWVAIPAALPAFVSGMKQGWSFAWRSLLAGEIIIHTLGVGSLLETARNLNDYPKLFAVMIVILLASVTVDKLLFATLERRIHSRWGLAGK